METFLVLLTASLVIASAGIVSVGIAWAGSLGAPRLASPLQETPRTSQESMPAHTANADVDVAPGQVEPRLMPRLECFSQGWPRNTRD